MIDLLPCELKKIIQNNGILIIPIGSIEFHGEHLPLGCDIIIAKTVANQLACLENVVVAPSLAYGITGFAVSDEQKGTINVNPSAFKEYAKDIVGSFYNMGFRKIIVISHHQGDTGANAAAFKFASTELFNELYNKLGKGWWTEKYNACDHYILKLKVLPATLDTKFFSGHGGKGETEAMIAMWDKNVNVSVAVENDYPWNWASGNSLSDMSDYNAKNQYKLLIEKWIETLKNY